MNQFQQKKNNLFMVLCGFFVANTIVAELIGPKIFSLEALLHLSPAQIPFFGTFKIDFNLSSGAVIWPLVFLISDLINEYFGREGVRKISYLTCVLIVFAFAMVYFTTGLPPAKFWVELNSKDIHGNNFDINFAFTAVMSQGINIVIASVIAFLTSQLLDAYLFSYLKQKFGLKRIWIRATGSTLIAQLIDTIAILMIAFYFLGNWSFEQVLAVGCVQYAYKVCTAIIMTPLLYAVHFWIDRYLGIEE